MFESNLPVDLFDRDEADLLDNLLAGGADHEVEELDDEATGGAARRLAVDRIVIDEILMEELLGQLRFVLVDRLFENADSRRLVCCVLISRHLSFTLTESLAATRTCFRQRGSTRL